MAADVIKKLRLRNSQKILVINAPVEYLALLTDFKFDNESVDPGTGSYDVVQIFATRQAEAASEVT